MAQIICVLNENIDITELKDYLEERNCQYEIKGNSVLLSYKRLDLKKLKTSGFFKSIEIDNV